MVVFRAGFILCFFAAFVVIKAEEEPEAEGEGGEAAAFPKCKLITPTICCSSKMLSECARHCEVAAKANCPQLWDSLAGDTGSDDGVNTGGGDDGKFILTPDQVAKPFFVKPRDRSAFGEADLGEAIDIEAVLEGKSLPPPGSQPNLPDLDGEDKNRGREGEVIIDGSDDERAAYLRLTKNRVIRNRTVHQRLISALRRRAALRAARHRQ